MFLHCFKYSFLEFIRNKGVLFWVVLFPMILGTLFNFAFLSIYDREDKFSAIPVAVVNGCEEGGIRTLIDSLEESGTEFLIPQYVTEEETLALLKDGEVDGVIYDDLLEPQLTVRSGGGMSVSILKVFMDRYKTNASVIREAAMQDPAQLSALLDQMKEGSKECLKLENLSKGNMNPYTSYFYNLMAMACLFVSMIGMRVSINAQANLSDVGARRCVAPTGKGVQMIAGLGAALVIFYAGITAAAAYLYFVLGIDFGISFAAAMAINFFGVLFGLAMGFFIGSLGRMNETAKTAVLLAVSLGTGFLSGLMAGSIPLVIEEHCPIINRINPSRLIADSYYALNSYGWGDRVCRDLATLAVMALLLIAAGCLATRRTKYKSL